MGLADRVAVNALAQIVAQAITAAATIAGLAVTTRYLPVRQFGEIQAALALVTMFQFMGDLGLSTIGARTLAQTTQEERDEVTGALWSASCVFTVVVVGAAVAVAFAAYHGSERLARTSALIMLAPLLLTPWTTVARAHVVVRQRTWVLSATTVTGRLASLAAICVAAALRLGPEPIAVASMLGTGIYALALIGHERRHLPRRLAIHLRRDPRVRALAAAGLSLSVITVINAIYFRLDAFLLSVLSTPRSVALYTVAYRVIDSLVVLPGYVMVTLVPELARLAPRDARSRAIVGDCLMAVWLLVMPVGAAIIVAPQIAVALGGERYRAAGVVLAILLPSAMMACLNSVLGNVMVAQSRQTVLIAVSAANLVLNSVLNVILIHALSARGAAIALLATELVSLTATAALYRRGAGPGSLALPRGGRSLLAGLACAAVMCSRYALASGGPALILPVALGGGSLVYVVAVGWLRAAPGPLIGLLRRLTASSRISVKRS